MTITLFAQPYDISAIGFYFETSEDYENHAANTLNDFGQRVEEFEIQFIDGGTLDCAIAGAWKLHQGNFETFLDAADDWDDDRKRRYIVAFGECGYVHDEIMDDPDCGGVDIYYLNSLRELAESFVEEGHYGSIPDALKFYIDYDAIAHDLAVDFSETAIAGERLVYACR